MRSLSFVTPLLASLLFISCANDLIPISKKSPTPPEQEKEEIKEPPETPLLPRTWKVAVISDMNRSYGSTSYTSQLKPAIDHIRKNEVSLVLSTGDMVAGQKSGLQYQAMWDSFHNLVTKPLGESTLPLLPSPGNHDASAGASFKKERDIYVTNFNRFPVGRYNHLKDLDHRVEFLPNVEQNYPLNYAVSMGPAVFIALDATAVGPLINNQIRWLEEVLIASRSYKLKVVFGHVPLYPFTFTKASEYLARGTASSGWGVQMEQLLEDHGVNYFLSGHHHAFYPGRRHGKVRFVSVPHLGSGRRVLLTKDRSFKAQSKEAFLYLSFDSEGGHELVALESPSMRQVRWSELPEAISLPSTSSSDCKDCGSFPSSFFLDQKLRSLFLRLEPVQ